MRVKRFFAKSTPAALQKITSTWGNNALVLVHRPVTGGIEILAREAQSARRSPRTAHEKRRIWAALLAGNGTTPMVPAMSLPEIEQRIVGLRLREHHNMQLVADIARHIRNDHAPAITMMEVPPEVPAPKV